MIATLEPTKDHATLLRALAALRAGGRDVRLELAGAGPLRTDLERLAAELEIAEQVRFLGDLPRAEVRRRLHGWDLLVHATRAEAFGLAVAEGMLAGRPVVATDAAGVDELIRPGQTGLLVPPDDAQALAEAVDGLLANPRKASRLAAEAQRFVKAHHGAARMAAAYETLIDELIGSG